MTMRKREEIEESTEYPLNHLAEFPNYALTQLQLLQLEVLLDIRELLSPPEMLEIKPLSDEEKEKLMSEWARILNRG